MAHGAQSLRVVRFGLRLAESIGFGTAGEYSAKWQEVLKLSSNKNRSERCPPEQENESKDGFVTWARVWQNLELSADSFVSLRREHG
jgi:hypothetical protein